MAMAMAMATAAKCAYGHEQRERFDRVHIGDVARGCGARRAA